LEGNGRTEVGERKELPREINPSGEKLLCAEKGLAMSPRDVVARNCKKKGKEPKSGQVGQTHSMREQKGVEKGRTVQPRERQKGQK